MATLDVIFDEVVIRRRVLASVFHGMTLFGTMNLLIPALFPDTRTLYALGAFAVLVNAFGAKTFGRAEYQNFYVTDRTQRVLYQPD